jgi:D-aminoacyl-tRNA deacylase
MVRRPLLHIHDELLDQRLPLPYREARVTLVFPSIHRSERNVPTLTVHPLGNPGPSAEVGGRPRTLVPTDARRMADALRRLSEREGDAGLSVTYEATHHGPELGLPAFFAEIGYGELSSPPTEAVHVLSDVLLALEPSPDDRVALALGGGHYAPHFTDLAKERRWAFGHILSRHALTDLDRPTAWRAFETSEGAEGIVYARAEDATHPAVEGVGPRLRDRDAPMRVPSSRSTAGASGT